MVWPLAARYLRAFSESGRGLAAVEFALIVPLLLLLGMGAVETGHYISVKTRFENTHSTIARIVSQLGSVTTSTAGEFTAVTWQSMMQMVPLLLPDVLDPDATGKRVLRSNWYTRHGVKLTISWVRMIPNGASYDAYVAWSVSNDAASLRPCNRQLTWRLASAADAPDSLPGDLRDDGTAIVVDLAFKDSLVTSSTLTSAALPLNLNFKSSSYFAPRNVTKIIFNSSILPGSTFVAPHTHVCPAYNL